MTRLEQRRTRLAVVTNQSARYRGRDRDIVVEIHPDRAELRLLGTRTRYLITWRGIFDRAAELYAREQRELRAKVRKEQRAWAERTRRRA